MKEQNQFPVSQEGPYCDPQYLGYPEISTFEEPIVVVQAVENIYDSLTHRTVNYSDCTDAALKNYLKEDARPLANYVVAKAQEASQAGHAYYVINIEDPNSQDSELIQQLEETIRDNYYLIPKGINIQIDKMSVYNSTKTTMGPTPINPNAQNVIAFDNLFSKFKAYAKQNSAFGYTRLSLQEQINALKNSEIVLNPSQEFIAWGACLDQLLQDAGDDKEKQAAVEKYVKATQDVLRNGESPEAIQAFQRDVLNELSREANNEKQYKKAADIAARFVIGIVLGVIIASTGPFILLAMGVVFAAIIALVAANFYKSETPEGRLYEGISSLSDKLGFFKSEKTHAAAEKFCYPNGKPAEVRENDQVNPSIGAVLRQFFVDLS